MKKFLIILIAFMAIYTAELYAKKDTVPTTEKAYIESDVDRIPTFMNSHFAEFTRWLESQMRYITFGNRVREVAYVRFVVEKSGELSEVEVYNCSTIFANNIRKALSKTPQFAPALKGGEAVRYRASLAISLHAKYEQVNTTTSSYRYRYPDEFPQSYRTTTQRMNHYFNTGQPMALYTPSSTSYRYPTYSRSYYPTLRTTTKVDDKVVYRNLSIDSSEGRYFEVGEVDVYPRCEDGSSFVSYVDWIMEDVYPVIIKDYEAKSSRVRINSSVTFSIFVDKDGSVYASSGMHNARNRVSKALVKRMAKSPKLLPALKDGEAVRYFTTVQIAMDRIQKWEKVSFAEQTKWSMAENVVFGTKDIDVMPKYGDFKLNSFFDAVTRQAYMSLPDEIRGGIESDVTVDIIIDKQGEMLRIEVQDNPYEELLKATIDALERMTPRWTPAEVYGQTVDCRVSTTISFEDIYSEYIETGEVGVAQHYMPAFKKYDANYFLKWVKSKIKTPSGVKASEFKGMAFVSFIVEKDGSLSNIKVISSSDEYIASEVMRVINKAPKWYAGVDANGPARVLIAMPIVFF